MNTYNDRNGLPTLKEEPLCFHWLTGEPPERQATHDEVCDHLQVTLRELKELRLKERLPHIRLSHTKIRYSPSAIETWVAERGSY